MRRLLISSLLLTACSDDDDGDTAASTTATSVQTSLTSAGTAPETSSTTADADASGSSTNASTSPGDGTTAGDATGPGPTTAATLDGSEGSSSGGGLDCTAPADCGTCWACALQGPCQAGADACLAEFNCSPSLVCIESQCAEGGLMQGCLDTCCMSCTDLGTCPMVDTVVQCAATQCAGLCGPASCP